MSERASSGQGHLRSGRRDLGSTRYEIHVGLANRPGTVVELESPPQAQEGEVLQLTLEDGRVLLCEVRGSSPYCRVVGERAAPGHSDFQSGFQFTVPIEPERRHPAARSAATIAHPCPRCLATHTIITHRGVTMTTLFCPACRHGWGEAPSAVAGAAHLDRRAVVRPESPDRREQNVVPTPVCTYCSTDAHVRNVRRTSSEMYFACSGCDAMWVLPRPRSVG